MPDWLMSLLPIFGWFVDQQRVAGENQAAEGRLDKSLGMINDLAGTLTPENLNKQTNWPGLSFGGDTISGGGGFDILSSFMAPASQSLADRFEQSYGGPQFDFNQAGYDAAQSDLEAALSGTQGRISDIMGSIGPQLQGLYGGATTDALARLSPLTPGSLYGQVNEQRPFEDFTGEAYRSAQLAGINEGSANRERIGTTQSRAAALGGGGNLQEWSADVLPTIRNTEEIARSREALGVEAAIEQMRRESLAQERALAGTLGSTEAQINAGLGTAGASTIAQLAASLGGNLAGLAGQQIGSETTLGSVGAGELGALNRQGLTAEQQIAQAFDQAQFQNAMAGAGWAESDRNFSRASTQDALTTLLNLLGLKQGGILGLDQIKAGLVGQGSQQLANFAPTFLPFGNALDSSLATYLGLKEAERQQQQSSGFSLGLGPFGSVGYQG